jgi:hypothetical protein
MFRMRDQKTGHGHIRGGHIFWFQIEAAHIRVVEHTAIKHIESHRTRGVRLALRGGSGLRATVRLSEKKKCRSRAYHEGSNYLAFHHRGTSLSCSRIAVLACQLCGIVYRLGLDWHFPPEADRRVLQGGRCVCKTIVSKAWEAYDALANHPN